MLLERSAAASKHVDCKSLSATVTLNGKTRSTLRVPQRGYSMNTSIIVSLCDSLVNWTQDSHARNNPAPCRLIRPKPWVPVC
jgi:hypothetical protein